MRFLDTNVLLYAALQEPGEEDKSRAAGSLIKDRELVLSAQVLQEFYVQATRATRPGAIGHARALAMVESLRRFRVVPITDGLVLAAIATHERFQVSYWDAAIIEAARMAGCATVLSEDLSDETDYGGVRVENPFAEVM